MGIFTRGNRPRAEKSIVTHPRFGRVELAVSTRARRITLTVRADGTVRLAVPYGVPPENGLRFLDSKTEWLEATLARHAARRTVVLPPYSTRNRELLLEPLAGTEKVGIKLTGDSIIIKYPDSLTPEDQAVQAAVKKGIEEAWRVEAKEILPPRLAAISAITGLKYRSVKVRNTVSKWGSCSARDDISLSLHLMRLPDHLIDYVLIHELCHTVHKNHGPEFHKLLDKLTSRNHPALRRELRNYHTRW